MDTLEDKLREEGDPDFELEGRFIFPDDRKNQWKGVIVEKNKDRQKVHALGWDLYIKYKECLTKRKFSVAVPYPKGGGGGCLELREVSYYQGKGGV